MKEANLPCHGRFGRVFDYSTAETAVAREGSTAETAVAREGTEREESRLDACLAPRR